MSKEALQAIADELKGKLEDGTAALKKENADILETTSETIGLVAQMAKANGKSVEEIRATQTEVSAKLNELTENVTKGFTAQEENTKALGDVSARLTDLLKDGNLAGVIAAGETPNEELKANALKFYKERHYFVHGTDKGAAKFDEKSINDDKVTEYAHAKSAVYSMFRSDASDNGSVVLTADQRKAISTVSHDDQYFLPTEISNQVIRCFTEETNFVGMFDNVRMGGHRLMFPIEPAEGVYAEWACEIDCDNEDTDLQSWGSLELVVKDLRAKACLTGTMARDSALDIEGRLGAIARRSFETKITRDYFSANPKGGMEGAFEAGNHVTIETAEAGALSYLDIVKLLASTPDRFASGSRLLMNCLTKGYIYTMTDASGRPLFDMSQNNIMGFATQTVDQMPSIGDETGLTAGVKALALVNPQEHYVLARREDFRASRNPYRKQNCGLIEWYFHMSLAGGVKCPNAFRALKIKEA